MAKFKVGDRVQCVDVKGVEVRLIEGAEYVVDGVQIAEWGQEMVALEGVVSPVEEGFFARRFRLIDRGAASPIRTVTRREIVSGIYGIVSIAPGAKRVAMVPKARAYTAEEYREAAHLFNQLAEVLEENSDG